MSQVPQKPAVQKTSGTMLLSRITPLVRDFVRDLRNARSPQQALEAIHTLLEVLQGPCWSVLTVQEFQTEKVVAQVGDPPEGWASAGFSAACSEIAATTGVRQMELGRNASTLRACIYVQCERQDLWEGIAPLLELASGEVLDLLEQEQQSALQQAHEATLAQLKSIMDNAPIGLALMDHQLRFLLINQKLADYNNKTVQEHLGRTMNEVYPGNEGLADQYFRQVLTSGQPVLDVELESRRYPGRYWLAHYFPVRTPQGTLLGVGCTVQDITDRKNIEHVLQESEQRFRQMADTAPVMVWMSSLDGDTAFYNKHWLEFRGRSSEQELGTGWMEGIHPEDLHGCLEIFAHNAEQQTAFEMEFRLLRHDGQYRWIVDRGVPRFTEAGVFLGFIGACIDIHDRKLAQESLEELMGVQKRFVADAAHELRTPLTSIQGNLDILFRYDRIPKQEQQEILRDVQREATRLGRLVHDMLQLARGDAGAALREEEIDLKRVVLNAWREIERISNQHEFVLGPLDPVTTIGDADRLMQLTLILLENAVKYSPDGGRISLSLTATEDQVHLLVQDTGQGIGAQDLPRVFERFYRADQSRHRSEDPGGTGLGLPIAKWIVEGHGGRIWIESEPGKGTTVHTVLPLQE
ncbi:PAS domain S-box protein [Deinococcus roseus]|uniref:histidine kinase n=1 Tax=Deinococcus roseus TaxID=392414 RepID=A0ABQ2CZ96_9DEIO|nr:PAS domain S-box protein [Deinococcus roseus]GGJ29067.1 hypothetical protein GCM10008938_13960 [Deinococcus roseus]